jgi:pyruvate decarboxylase
MPSEIEDRELKCPVDVAEYLFTRLHQLGIRSVHGVPGIYILNALSMPEF